MPVRETSSSSPSATVHATDSFQLRSKALVLSAGTPPTAAAAALPQQGYCSP